VIFRNSKQKIFGLTFHPKNGAWYSNCIVSPSLCWSIRTHRQKTEHPHWPH